MGKKRINGEGTFTFNEKKGYWHYKLTLGYAEDGKPIRKSFYGKSRSEAKAKGDKALEELQGRSVSVSPDMTLEKWMPLYLESYKKGTVKEKWYSMLLDLVKKIPPNLGKKKVSEITPIELQRFINSLSEKYSKSYTQKAKILVKSALEEATENGLCVKNPARKLTVPDKPEKPREKTRKSVYLHRITAFWRPFQGRFKWAANGCLSAPFRRRAIVISAISLGKTGHSREAHTTSASPQPIRRATQAKPALSPTICRILSFLSLLLR